MRPLVAGLVGVACSFMAAFYLMLFAGAAHGWDHAIPTLSYWQSWLGAFLYGCFHNASTWPGAGHKTEDL